MFVCQFQNIIYARIQEEAHRILQMQDIKGVIWEKLDIIHSQIPASYHYIIYGIYFTLHVFLYFKFILHVMYFCILHVFCILNQK